jgi:hypothetical protein
MRSFRRSYGLKGTWCKALKGAAGLKRRSTGDMGTGVGRTGVRGIHIPTDIREKAHGMNYA